jgi:RimJ/RimL family protein N-acetyltransferase
MQSTNDTLSLRGEKVGLRARRATDVPVLQAELYDGDVVGRSRSTGSPWLPQSADVDDLSFAPQKAAPNIAIFSIVELASGELAGAAVLSLIDPHNRSGNVGLSLLPAFRGRGLATDAVRVLCEYGFATRGLNRLQIGTLADNDAMIRTALAAGFTQEGVLRENAWINGAFADEVLLGRLSPFTH